MSSVRLDGVRKAFGDHVVVHDVSLSIDDGEFVALLGPSGSGKTTILRMIAGFEHPDAGTVQLDGADVTVQPAAARRCGMVFQHYALFPHLDVGDNVAYGLHGAGLGRDGVSARVAEALALVDLSGLERRPVAQLSGGQQQRVALARAIAPRPRVLLLDEPLSNLDPSLRERTRRELRDVIRRVGITTVLVTHEQEEAFDLADRVALLHDGVLAQLGTPEALYHEPATPFVASFIGRSTLLDGEVAPDGTVTAGGIRWNVAGPPGARMIAIAVRPEALRLDPAGDIVGTVTLRRFAGALAFFAVSLAGGAVLEVAGAADAARVGEAVRLAPTGAGVHVWPRPA